MAFASRRAHLCLTRTLVDIEEEKKNEDNEERQHPVSRALPFHRPFWNAPAQAADSATERATQRERGEWDTEPAADRARRWERSAQILA